jgi:DNA-binding response OmpR family regulator
MAVVLIVEDDPALCDLMRQVLEEEGHRTVIANSLDEAKRAACNESTCSGVLTQAK